jgi:glycine betaine/proline transport system permease protein
MMAGASERQLFWQVRVPTASRQLLLGVNQTTMAALSMVIIASIIGGTADIGWEVLSTIRKATFGESLLAGAVIALIAMVMDRVSRGFATQEADLHAHERPFLLRHAHFLAAGALAVATFIAVPFLPFLTDYPHQWTFYPAAPINDAILYIVVEYKHVISTIKQVSFFYVMLPLRIGLESTVRPSTWGFDPAGRRVGLACRI